MEKKPQVVEAELIDGGVHIIFNDGLGALYSSELLYATLPQAQKVDEEGEDQKMDQDL
jgi:hypothetical protein